MIFSKNPNSINLTDNVWGREWGGDENILQIKNYEHGIFDATFVI